MQNLLFLLDTAADGAGNPGSPISGIITWVIMIALLIGMFFFTSRSNKKREKEAADMRDNLQVGDEVTTIGGIIGKVVSIKEETFVLETTKEKTQIRFLKAAIRSVDVKIADITAAAAEEAKAEENESKK
ncbi:MAG: preprotein translocase subunit YajC [Clostridia bacterium]|nr:preprotein translocase subunit YajC [Clostridia bacterium]